MEQEQEAPTQEQELPPVDVQEVAEEAAPKEEEAAPTKSVKNFWERLDEVFTQNVELKQRMEELVEQFPSEQRVNTGPYRSFIFQPERICLTSNESLIPSTEIANQILVDGGHEDSETFSKFRVRLPRALVNVKSIELLSCVIPNAVANIPDNQLVFGYYKIRSVAMANRGAWNGATAYKAGDIVTYLGQTWACGVAVTGTVPQIYWNLTQLTPTPTMPVWDVTATYLTGALVQYNGRVYQSQSNSNEGKIPDVVYWVQTTLPADTTRPNYYDLNPEQLQIFYFIPTFGPPPEDKPPNQQLMFNRTFQDYDELVLSLNAAAEFNATIPNDVSFVFNPQQNKIQFIPSATALAAGYFYMPAGYEDPNFRIAAEAATNVFPGIFTPGYTLNLRCGFTWNGLFPNPFLFQNIWATDLFARIVFWYLRPYDTIFPPATAWNQQLVTFNKYPDLVHTSCVKIYTDVTLGSTEEAQHLNQETRDGILGIVPVNTTNLGVGFYQNTLACPLTKVSRFIPEFGISLYTDQGAPYLLPNSATVLLELGITYH